VRFALAFILALAATFAAHAAAPAPPTANLQGIWDLFWTTRRGPRQSGYLRFEQNGSALNVEMHGRGSVRARGTVSGASFTVRGTRMLVPYRIEGRVAGDRMEGAFKVMNRELRFTGARRR
jgi:hypothetical protein